MKKRIEYHEEQRMRSWWMWTWILFANLLVFLVAFREINFQEPFNDDPVTTWLFIAVILFILILSGVLLFSKLTTIINEEGVYFRYFPFHFRYKFIPWDEVEEIKLRKIQPFFEFGGYGIKKPLGIRFNQKITGYIVSGKYAFELRLKIGKLIVITTTRPDEMAEIVNTIGK